jgi:hypothetical protein
MKGDALTFILIVTVSVSLTALVLGWAVMNMTGYFEINEVNSVRQEFSDCNNKILETARTGMSNRCEFSAKMGHIVGKADNITYEITSSKKICDMSSWAQVNPEKNTWQRCDISGRESIYSLLWNYSGIRFQYGYIGNVYVIGQTGKSMEFSRYSMNDTQIDLMAIIS